MWDDTRNSGRLIIISSNNNIKSEMPIPEGSFPLDNIIFVEPKEGKAKFRVNELSYAIGWCD